MQGQTEQLWDKFAAKNAEYYIITETSDYSTEAAKKSFYRSGEEFTRKSLEEVEDLLPSRGRALEIGCGIGRLTFPHAREFSKVTAVDVSPVMLERFRENTISFGGSNIRTCLSADRWDNTKYDYIYSFLVFQHIWEIARIEKYIDRFASCLKPKGIAQLQFDTRPATLLHRFRNRMPDFLLPRNQRKGIRRIRRNPQALREIFRRFGLDVVRELHPESPNHTFILRPAETARKPSGSGFH